MMLALSFPIRRPFVRLFRQQMLSHGSIPAAATQQKQLPAYNIGFLTHNFLVMLITHLTHFQTSTIGEQYKKREFFCNHSFGQTGRLRLSGHLNSNTVLPTIKLVQIGNFSNFGILKVAIFGKRAIFGTLKCHFQELQTAKLANFSYFGILKLVIFGKMAFLGTQISDFQELQTPKLGILAILVYQSLPFLSKVQFL